MNVVDRHITATAMARSFLVFGTVALASSACFAGDPTTLLKTYCLDCHSGDDPDGGLSLDRGIADVANIDWRSSHVRTKDQGETLPESAVERWERIYQVISKALMPPPDADQPSGAERQHLVDSIDKLLVENTPVGGTTLRRLSRREYTNTIRQLFALDKFEVPASFPPDNRLHGFDNQGSSLVLSGSHMEALAETAIGVADQFFPPPDPPVKPRSYQIDAADLVISYSSACLIDGAMRLASSGPNIVRNATWLSKFEAPAAGVYEIELKLSSIHPPAGHQPMLRVSSMNSDRSNVIPIAEFTIGDGKPQRFEAEVELQKGETLVFEYPNGPFNYDDKKVFREFIEQLFADDPRLAAAWATLKKPARGGGGWEKLRQQMDDPKMDVDRITSDTDLMETTIRDAGKNSVSSGETLVYKFFEQGPAVGIHQVEIHGPTRDIQDREQVARQQHKSRLMGRDADNPFVGESGHRDLQDFFRGFLANAFRRPPSNDEVDAYTTLVLEERERTNSLEQGLHLAIRSVLISPAFLFRCIGNAEASTEQLTTADLATRLSFFLTSHPPDARLTKAANQGNLSKSEVLLRHAKRLLHSERSSDFVHDFTSQWLGTDHVDQLMPDARLVKRFDDRNRRVMKEEVERTFQHILRSNASTGDFIAPDFMFTDALVGWEIYRIEQFKPNNDKARSASNKGIQEISIPKFGRHGGLLGMSAVMMSTANGVDTQPVLRGVWVLENLLGMPPPEPPDSVPALTPDTTGAKTPKEKLAAHAAEQSCAICHREIDPVGFALENFDPIGRWRDHYPVYEDHEDGTSITRKGAKVDATGRLPDGTEITDVTDLKRWLTKHPELFARCLSEKLLSYATGRSLSYRERSIVAKIVEDQAVGGLGFEDLLLALIDSQVFRAK